MTVSIFSLWLATKLDLNDGTYVAYIKYFLNFLLKKLYCSVLVTIRKGRDFFTEQILYIYSNNFLKVIFSLFNNNQFLT